MEQTHRANTCLAISLFRIETVTRYPLGLCEHALVVVKRDTCQLWTLYFQSELQVVPHEPGV